DPGSFTRTACGAFTATSTTAAITSACVPAESQTPRRSAPRHMPAV
ncbi:hypothetical protein JAO32_18195, partial [Terriglobus sp. ADX1]